VTARFALNPQIGAGPPPFHPVGRDPPATRAKLREEMGQLMTQGPVDLSLAVSGETAVEQNTYGSVFGPAGGAAKTSRPLHTNLRGQTGHPLLEEEVAGRGFERRIAAGSLFNNRGCE
jgi:hypothetical protein